MWGLLECWIDTEGLCKLIHVHMISVKKVDGQLITHNINITYKLYVGGLVGTATPMPEVDGRPTPNQDATVVDSLFKIACGQGKFSKLHQGHTIPYSTYSWTLWFRFWCNFPYFSDMM